MNKVTIAKSAGFCFGVERAVKLLEQEVVSGRKVCTLGPIIHNPQVVDDFVQRGVLIIDTVDQAPTGYKVVIRSHGVEQNIYDLLGESGTDFLDATCPYVTKIHKIVKKASTENQMVLIAGDRNHPEVQGILGHCTAEVYTFADVSEFKQLALIERHSYDKNCILIAQTTFNLLEWQKCISFARKAYTKIRLFDTICSATMLRQQEAEDISKSSDYMIVIGGRGSSNTAKLAEICSKYCRTALIESAMELKSNDIIGAANIGVTAGASTPAFIIKEVQTTMSDILNQQDEMSFEEMLEQSFKTIRANEKVTAVVTSVSQNEIAVDVGTKHAGYVPLAEFTDDPNVELQELVKVGDEIELLVLRVNDVEGTAMLSKKRLDSIAGFEKIIEAEEKEEVLEGTVVDVVKGGVIAICNSVRIFIPASQATPSRGEPLEDLLKKKVRFRILETNKQRRRAVGSIRAVLREEQKEKEEKFWNEVEEGKVYTGKVKSLTSYGAFVDLGGVDGMIHISELSWVRIKHPSEVVSVDQEVQVYVREVDKDNRKISLGYKQGENNPWEILKRDNVIGETRTVKVVSLTQFGAFAQVIPGVDGLIHISQISNERVNKPSDVLEVGQEVEVKVTDIDFDKRRVSLSIRALLGGDDAENASDDQAGVPDEDRSTLVYEAGPDNIPAEDAGDAE